MRVVCEFCGETLNPKGSSVYVQVMGWIEPGKTSGLKLATGAAGWAHRTCVEIEHKKRRGQVEQTETLF